jgi:KDO2-lipid IV(A) lauroyltransferase
MRKVIEAIEGGSSLGILVDQKMNTGIEAPFFGMPAKTTQLPATLALKYNLPIMLCKVTRITGINYHFDAEPLQYNKTQSSQEITAIINKQIEQWIVTHPAQWFWVHRRWNLPYKGFL